MRKNTQISGVARFDVVVVVVVVVSSNMNHSLTLSSILGTVN